MKKTARKTLAEKLLAAANKVLRVNKVGLTSKTENALVKAIKKITRKITKNETIGPPVNKKTGLNGEKKKTHALVISGTSNHRAKSNSI